MIYARRAMRGRLQYPTTFYHEGDSEHGGKGFVYVDSLTICSLSI